jgi:hypothetical protein
MTTLASEETDASALSDLLFRDVRTKLLDAPYRLMSAYSR